MELRPPVCFIGGAHVDLTGRLAQTPVMAASNPGKLLRRPGGAGLNSASATARLGIATYVAGPVGDDAEGSAIRAELAARGIGDSLATLHTHATGTYASILDPHGELVIGLADLSIQEAIGPDWLLKHCAAGLRPANSWFLTANLAEGTLSVLAECAEGRALAAGAVSPAKAVRLRPILSHLDLLFCNLAEARAIAALPDGEPAELARKLAAHGTGAGAISCGPGSLVFWQDGQVGQLQPPHIDRIVDVHGAGDTLAAATMAALMVGMDFADGLRYGIAAAQLTIVSAEPWRPDLTWPLLARHAESVSRSRPA